MEADPDERSPSPEEIKGTEGDAPPADAGPGVEVSETENGTGPAEGADGDAGDAAGDGDEPNEDKAEGGDVGEIELEVGPAHEGREGETSEEQRLNALSAWIRRRILIRGLERNEEFSEENELIVREFLTHPGTRKLVAYMGEDGLAVATFRNPPLDAGDTEFVYFVKRGDAELTPDNVARHVRFGCSRGNALESLLHTMVGVHAPRAATYRRMPATVQKDFAANLHRFMASLTEAAHHARGKTVLYLPGEDLEDPQEAAADKDLVRRLESTVIRWTRQIKQVVTNSQEGASTAEESGGPLEEIAFWRSRMLDLSGITDQLNLPKVKQIVATLEAAESSYLAPYLKLADMIQNSSVQATDNLRFLTILAAPCEKLEAALPADIPALFPPILQRIRFITMNSKFYQGDHIAGLIRKVNHSIIRRCAANINLEDVYGGNVAAAVKVLKDSIACGARWRHDTLVMRAQINSVAEDSGRKWDFDETGLFAQIDAFVQRCRGLLEICEGQGQFARRALVLGEEDEEMPSFGGASGEVIRDALVDIERQFGSLVKELRMANYDVLDVNASAWHSDLQRFANGVKELEMHTTKVFDRAAEQCATVGQGVELLESFYKLAKRPTIKQCADRNAMRVYDLFRRSMERVKQEFEAGRHSPPLRGDEPQYAGAALWARGLRQRVALDWEKLEGAHYMRIPGEDKEAVCANVEQLVTEIDDYIMAQYRDGWMADMEGETHETLMARLQVPLMNRVKPDEEEDARGTRRRGRTRVTFLAVNFDPLLLKLFSEVHYWSKLSDMDVAVKYDFHEVNSHRDRMRVLRGHVLEVVRQYNSIIASLTDEERRLLREHIRRLDKRIAPGLSKLNWSSKPESLDLFLRESRKKCEEMQATVRTFKAAHAEVQRLWGEMEGTLLVKLARNHIYEVDEFLQTQERHLAAMRTRLYDLHTAMRRQMVTMAALFLNDGQEVQREWRSFTARKDREVETALRGAARKSLQELARAIRGDRTHEPRHLLRIYVVIEGVDIKFSPMQAALAHSISSASKTLVSALEVVPRLSEVMVRELERLRNPDLAPEPEEEKKRPGMAPRAPSGTIAEEEDEEDEEDEDEEGEGGAAKAAAAEKKAAEAGGEKEAAGEEGAEAKWEAGAAAAVESADKADKRPSLPSFHEKIAGDNDLRALQSSILTGLTEVSKSLNAFTEDFKRDFSSVWSTPKESFLRRYARNPPKELHHFANLVKRYKDIQAEVQAQPSVTMHSYLAVDTSKAKAAVVEHCVEWQQQFTQLFNRLFRADLEEVTSFLTSSAERVMQQPETLAQLSEALSRVRDLSGEGPAVKAKFERIRASYAMLEDQPFQVAITEEERELLDGLDERYREFEEALEAAGSMLERTKKSMKKQLEESLDSLSTEVTELRKSATDSLPFAADVSVDEAWRALRKVETSVAGLRRKEKEMEAGLEIFRIDSPHYPDLEKTEWELERLRTAWTLRQEWEEFVGGVDSTPFSRVDSQALENKAGQFNKRVVKLGREIKSWRVQTKLKEDVDKFRATMPLIQALSNPAMRPRHWRELQEEVGHEFDPASDSFTLRRMFEMQLHTHEELIMELSTKANQQAGIESNLRGIAEQWADLELDVVPHKDKYHKLRSSEDVSTALEDDQVSLSSMKASRHFDVFEADITKWEKLLSIVSQVLDVIFVVQRKWMYLENIFMQSEDIQRQLPAEAALFYDINARFSTITKRFNDVRNCRKCCAQEGLLETLNTMDETLDRVQRELDQWLETKRMYFPRFYFLSNDDLLEILGQQKDPQNVQRHIKKCFEGIFKLHMIEPGAAGNNKTHEALRMLAPDGEEVAFLKAVVVAGAVEKWMKKVEEAMVDTLKMRLREALRASSKKKELWIKENEGQLLITVSKINWTMICEQRLREAAHGSRKALKQLKKKWVSNLNRLADFVRGDLPKVLRKKLVALITMELHSRDVIEKLIKSCKSPDDFEWQMQLRYYYDDSVGDYGLAGVRQTSTSLEYSYEYQGNNGRLVVTPLTDRCVLTLTTAMYLHRGGNPLGPAGTGKTETVKDLGKNLAKFVVVFNCSDGLNYKNVGRIFSGLVQSGGWGCFDEFNRINVEVLSVVAQQILSIMNALAAYSKDSSQNTFWFMDREIPVQPSCGVYITMNPGYAGRSELPDNLKALMRPCAMMVPDLSLICEVMLQAEGFRKAKELAKKTVSLYSLMVQQLSKQDHYDYGLRSIKAVLNCAGGLKRAAPEADEAPILLRALKDMNVPKFIKEDYNLFLLLLHDLFPSLSLPAAAGGALFDAVGDELVAEGLQRNDAIMRKVIELEDSKQTRHCNMLVGETLAGKSTAWRTLAGAKSAQMAAEAGEERGSKKAPKVTAVVLNPKSVALEELYGYSDVATFEWTDGILSKVFRDCSTDTSPGERWIILDGPVDTLWIESMNSVMDDNKVLTLINGDRISMSSSMALLFEVQDLSQASPATVSRAGMVYLDVSDLGWGPYVTSWLQRRFGDSPEDLEFHRALFDKYVGPTLQYKAKNRVPELVPVSDFQSVRSLCALYDALAAGTREQVGAAKAQSVMEKWFTFALVWSVAAAATEHGRKLFSMFISEIEAQFPTTQTVYDYQVDPAADAWKPWEDHLAGAPWRPAPGVPFHKLVVPTVDTLRNAYVVRTLVHNRINALATGGTGTGKTVLVESVLGGLPATHSKLVVNFSSATSSKTVQEVIEGSMEKRSASKMVPKGGKRMVAFVDDLNMPAKDTYGSQPPLELLRQWCDYGCWYDRKKQHVRHILDMQLVAAMGPPGGGRTQIPPRLQSRFHLLNLTMPSDTQLQRIFESILVPRMAGFEEEARSMAPRLVAATISLYHRMTEKFLPTPEKSHYLFNLRDMARVVEGVLMAQPAAVDSQEAMLRLWSHEAHRTFGDRLIHDEDRDRFRGAVSDQLSKHFDVKWEGIMRRIPDPRTGPVFADFLTEAGAGDDDKGPYEEVMDLKRMRDTLESRLDDYNLEPKFIPMELVMFKDAMMHLARISRVLRQPRGNLLLVGVGGSGRRSLTRLASYISGCEVRTIEISKKYRLVEFREDLKTLYMLAGVEGKPTVFLFADTQIKEEGFLEDVNNILSSGVVPNLHDVEDLPAIFDAMRGVAKDLGLTDTQPDALWELFIDRVRANLHVVLCMSPIGEGTRTRMRAFPGLVSCTTIDWYNEWPAEALREVALKFLENESYLKTEEMKGNVAEIFASVHKSVERESETMWEQLRRRNYVTPTSYLGLVVGYKSLLKEKRQLLHDSCSKLRSGVDKLDESRQQVEELSKELEVKKTEVEKKKKECQADKQRKQVEADSERIAAEEKEAKEAAEEASHELDVALPALDKAMQQVDALDKGSISEVKGYSQPPALVEMVMQAVMMLFKVSPPTWPNVKKKVAEVNFLQQVKNFDKDNISNATLSKIKKYTKKEDFSAEKVAAVSHAAGALCTWVLAMELYANVYRDVLPKKQKVASLSKALAVKQETLRKAQSSLAELMAKVDELNKQYEESVGEKDRLDQNAKQLEAKLQRAEQLVTGLGGERERWEGSIAGFEESLRNVVGDALVGAAFLSYAGPFESGYRASLTKEWMRRVAELEIPLSRGFSFTDFLAKPTDVRDWNIQGLPRDDFSTENGVIVTRGDRWPLMIDPQGQANKWIKKLEGRQLILVDPKMKDYLKKLENAVQFGLPLLMQDIGQEVDPALEPVLSKSIKKEGTREVMKIGDSEVDYNHDFKFYLTTKLSNPHYTPEISTKTTIVNFVVKESGLQAQLLGIVVRLEEPVLETKKEELVVRVAGAKRKLVELEDEILRLLFNAEGSLLDDEELVNTLQVSKTTAEEVTQQLRVSEETEKKIDLARMGYKPVAKLAAVLFFVLVDMSAVDPMYQFSLDAYVDLFTRSINDSRGSTNSGAAAGAAGKGRSGRGAGGATGAGGSSEKELAARIEEVNAHHMLAVYTYACRGLFVSHKLLFSFQMCVKKLQSEGKISPEEYDFFLRGGVVMDREGQPVNPCADWLPEAAWDHITELDKYQNFEGLVRSFEQSYRDWKDWFLQEAPEMVDLPGEWESRLDDLQRLIIVRCLRPDRAMLAAQQFIERHLGAQFVSPPGFNLREVVGNDPSTPLIFVLSPGVDPGGELQEVATDKGIPLSICALGQGQEDKARSLIQQARTAGEWVLLANCHLMLSWMPELEKVVEGLQPGSGEEAPHPSFRLWLSSDPSPHFPISILQRGIKMTTEPPQGVRANMLRLYDVTSDDQFTRCTQGLKFRKLLYCLCWFHTTLIERRKFKTLGWNVPYDFNLSDFSISVDVLITYLDNARDTVPWKALKYLIAEANYGGRVTDDKDRRLVNVYVSQFFTDDAINMPNFPLCESGRDSRYHVPDDGDKEAYKQHIRSLPGNEHPSVLGQHPNAQVASQIADTQDLLETVLSLQPRRASEGGRSPQDIVHDLACELLEQVPPSFDLEAIHESLADRSDPIALVTVLKQELERYSRLLDVLRTSLDQLRQGIKGLVVITPELEAVFNALLLGKVPEAWSFAYPSLKPLGSWMRDLLQREAQMRSWAEERMPTVFWLSGFTYPNGFLTALLQTTARNAMASIDSLSWDFIVLNQDEETLTQSPSDGAYVKGLFLEGARWDEDAGSLDEPYAMQLQCPMPIVHFKPVDNKKKSSRGTYSCPLYLYPVRTGTRERPSYMISIDLKSGSRPPEFWIKRGTALLLSTAE